MGTNKDTSMTGLYLDMKDVLESVKDGIIVIDRSGKVLVVNSACALITGLSAGELTGRNIDQLKALGCLPSTGISEVLVNKEAVHLIENIKGRDFLVMANPIFSKDGELNKVVVILTDIFYLNELASSLQATQKPKDLGNRDRRITREVLVNEGVVARSTAMKRVLLLAQKVSQVDSNVLVTGETGVGKEVVARLICKCSNRKDGPFIRLNCGAIPETLLESELFGYEPGAFTGAKKDGKPGLVELADGGVLFLDEIADLPVNLQVKLLRVLQEREVLRVGGTRNKKVDFRLIAATNRNLGEMVRNHEFREDLFYRLNVISIDIPPLRQRKEDIIPLISSFLNKFNNKYGFSKKISLDVIQSFQKYEWPGNIRELENVIERLVVISDSNVIIGGNLMENSRIGFAGDSGPKAISDIVQETEKQLISHVCQHCKTTRQMADALGISQSTVVKKMKKYGITRS